MRNSALKTCLIYVRTYLIQGANKFTIFFLRQYVSTYYTRASFKLEGKVFISLTNNFKK